MFPKGRPTIDNRSKRLQLRLSDSNYKAIKVFYKQLKKVNAEAARERKAMMKAIKGETESKKK